MILHIKPTAAKHEVFRFKSNFIRFYNTFETSKGSAQSALTDGIGVNGDGIVESAGNIEGHIQSLIEKNRKVCAAEIKAFLKEAARELDIPLT